MKIRKYIKIIFTGIALIILLLIVTTTVGASFLGNIVSGSEEFIQKGNPGTKIGNDEINDLSTSLYNILLVIGVIVAAIVGLVLGIQFMIGSVEQKSKVKESLIPYCVGCAVIFGAFGIWKLVVTILGAI